MESRHHSINEPNNIRLVSTSIIKIHIPSINVDKYVLQLQNSESVIENNIFLWTTRFIDWIERLKFEFKFGITLVLELKSIESDNETKYSTFH